MVFQYGTDAQMSMLADLSQRIVQPIVQAVLGAQFQHVVHEDDAVNILIEAFALLAAHAPITVQVVELDKVQDIRGGGRTPHIRVILGVLRRGGRCPGGRGRQDHRLGILMQPHLDMPRLLANGSRVWSGRNLRSGHQIGQTSLAHTCKCVGDTIRSIQWTYYVYSCWPTSVAQHQDANCRHILELYLFHICFYLCVSLRFCVRGIEVSHYAVSMLSRYSLDPRLLRFITN